jgi:subtilisin family serine protease
MLSVGSVDLDDSLSTFSNFGASVVKIAATGAESSSRGIGLLSTFPGNTYARMMGTSMATPVVSGAAALAIYLMRAKGYRPTPAQIETILTNSARSVSSLVTRVNGGRVMDIGNLVAYIDRNYSKSSSPAITCP